MPLIARPAAGQIVDPAWGTLVADAVVMRFTTTAQRASQLTAPVQYQLTSIDARPGVVQYWTGSAWVDVPGPGTELAYAERTLQQSITATSEAAADVVVTAPAITVDGTTPVIVEVFAPAAVVAPAAGATLLALLYQDGVSIGRMAALGNPAGGQFISHVHATRRFTPAAGSRTFAFRASNSGGAATLFAGAGGAGLYMPVYIRVTRA